MHSPRHVTVNNPGGQGHCPPCCKEDRGPEKLSNSPNVTHREGQSRGSVQRLGPSPLHGLPFLPWPCGPDSGKAVVFFLECRSLQAQRRSVSKATDVVRGIRTFCMPGTSAPLPSTRGAPPLTFGDAPCWGQPAGDQPFGARPPPGSIRDSGSGVVGLKHRSRGSCFQGQCCPIFYPVLQDWTCLDGWGADCT